MEKEEMKEECDGSIGQWLSEYAVSSVGKSIKALDVAQEAQLKRAWNIVGWTQPVLLALTGMVAAQPLSPSVRIAAGLALFPAFLAMGVALHAQRSRSWITAIDSKSWLRLMDDAGKHEKADILRHIVEGLSEACDRNTAVVAMTQKQAHLATCFYAAVPIAAVVGWFVAVFARAFS